jgi:hypothetical protein
MEASKPLIQQMKEAGDLQPIKEKPLRTYYTCVRYRTVELGTSGHAGVLGTPLTYYGPAQWSCMKGWFETHDNTFRGKSIDLKVVDYCKFRPTDSVLLKDLGAAYALVTPKS